MLEIAFIRQSPEVVIDRLAVKNVDAKTAISEILTLDEKKRAVQTKLEDLLAELNKASKEIGDLYKAGKKQEADELKTKTATWKQDITTLEAEERKTEQELLDKSVLLPNLPNKSVPKGKTPEDNEVVFQHGDLPQFEETALP